MITEYFISALGDHNMAQHSSETPQKSTAAVLKDSAPVSDDVPQVRGIEFNDYTGQDISVIDLLSGMENMGFQASKYPSATRSSHLL